MVTTRNAQDIGFSVHPTCARRAAQQTAGIEGQGIRCAIFCQDHAALIRHECPTSSLLSDSFHEERTAPSPALGRGNAFGSIEPQVTTTSETSCWEDQRLNRCSGYVLLKTPRPMHSMQARLPRSQCTFSLANQRHIAGSLPMPLSSVDRLLAQRVPQISHGHNPRASLGPHTGGTPSDFTEQRRFLTSLISRVHHFADDMLRRLANGSSSRLLKISKFPTTPFSATPSGHAFRPRLPTCFSSRD